MNLLEVAIAVAESTNLEIGVIAEVVHTTSLASTTVLINAAVNSGASTPQAVQQLTQICAMSSTGSPSSTASAAVTGVKSNYGQSAAEIFLSGDRLCFCCGRKLGRRDGEYRGTASGKCPMAGDQETVRKGKVRMANFKALQEKHPLSGRCQAGGGKSTWRRQSHEEKWIRRLLLLSLRLNKILVKSLLLLTLSLLLLLLPLLPLLPLSLCPLFHKWSLSPQLVLPQF